ncbi:MAG: hypothetical protein BroJett030_01210 [Alphaproteobacteria bacterium]|nr:MAG: hypothetical protein BroJett030_01210 [Alphaproteobacteria bacterium]
MVVAIDQYAALSLAVATRKPVEMAFWVASSDLLVSFSACNAVIAEALVLMLDIGVSLAIAKSYWDIPADRQDSVASCLRAPNQSVKGFVPLAVVAPVLAGKG